MNSRSVTVSTLVGVLACYNLASLIEQKTLLINL
jgi:hypothetical protein